MQRLIEPKLSRQCLAKVILPEVHGIVYFGFKSCVIIEYAVQPQSGLRGNSHTRVRLDCFNKYWQVMPSKGTRPLELPPDVRGAVKTI